MACHTPPGHAAALHRMTNLPPTFSVEASSSLRGETMHSPIPGCRLLSNLPSAARRWISGIRHYPVGRLLVAHALVLIPALRAVAADSPSPVALLRGVELARTKSACLRATLEIYYVSPPPATTVQCLVELDGNRRRFEVFPGKEPGQVIIRDGDEFHGFRRKQHEDVHIYDLLRATGVRGDLAFDPRVLGLNDLMPCHVTVRDCLWHENQQKLELVGQESVQGIAVWRVRAARDEDTSDYWIEEPSFRVHRRTLKAAGMQIVIESEFESSQPGSPFPSRVVARRDTPERKHEQIYIIKSFDAGAHISPDRFTLKSMELPVNTPVVDYRISRIVGYWDGEGLSQSPVYSGPQPVAPPASKSRRLPLIATNLLVVLALMIVVWWRWRAARSKS